MNASRLQRWSAAGLIALSLVALGTVVSGYLGRPPVPETDEGAQAHLFQLSIVALAPTLALFLATADWRRPRHAVWPLAIAGAAVALAFVLLYHLEHPR